MTDTIALVLNPQPVESLSALAEKLPVWVVSTSENAAAVQALRSSLPPGHLTTILKRPGESDEDLAVRSALDIDDHYGAASQPNPYTVLWVIGSNDKVLAEQLKEDLEFNGVEMTSDGFKVMR
ncbi:MULTISPECIES: hypothetical protein [unclassified Dyella]|uniref:hypothetical protein n=1 Tax=unclassified Dyella TaxID=2634549 RepID=UPI003F920D03